MKIAYVRVSSIDQNEARQVEALEKYGIERWYTEKISGKDANRPKLLEMLEYVREGDTIHIHDLSRLARSTADLLVIVDLLTKKGVHLVSNKENIDSSTPTGKLMLTMIGAINEFERTNILERTREGIAIAKRKGVYKGPKPKSNIGIEHESQAVGQTIRNAKYSNQVIENLMKVYDKVGDEIFGNSKVVEILGCSETTATAYIKILSTELNLIDPVAGHGKSKYIFKK